MITMKLDDKYDITLNQFGQIATVINYDNVIQNVITALKLIQGEYDFDILKGMPYFLFLGEKPDDELFKEYINYTVMQVVGVQQVVSSTYIFEKQTRTYNYFLTIQLENGETVNVNT